ncbi:MAG: coproporphyrinogen III oxidase, partial [Acetatifactor sp.]|nr:coproporphyrinogen III oxidase [Acetatifactor sp.]
MKELTKGVLELYLHIPFCVKKCLYCDFLSGPADRTVMAAYVEALKAELEGRAEGFADFKVTSVFLGEATHPRKL